MDNNKKIVLLAVLLSLVYVLPLVVSFKGAGIQDWDQHLAYLEAGRKSVVDYGQFPLWNPYHCGGMPLFGNPQSMIFSATFLLVLVFGAVWGSIASIVVHYVIGFLGMYYFLDNFKFSKDSKILGSCVFIFSSALSSSVAVGMLPFLGVAYMPWALGVLVRAFSRKKIKTYSIWLGIILALMFYSGYQVILYFLPVLIIFVLYESIDRGWKRSLSVLFISFFVFVLMASPKLLLSVELMSYHPREITDHSGYSMTGFFQALANKNQGLDGNVKKFAYDFGMDESSMYIGLLPLLLGIVGAVVLANSTLKAYVVLPILVVVLFLIRWSYFPYFWDYLRIISPFNQMRVSQRFGFSFLLFYSLLISKGFDVVVEKIKMAGYFRKVLLALVFISLFSVGSCKQLRMAFIVPLERLNAEENIGKDFYQSERGNKKIYGADGLYSPWSNEYNHINNNIGVLDCYEPIFVDTKAIGKRNNEYLGEVFSSNDLGVAVNYWSPNTIVVGVNHTNMDIGEIVVNQNYDSGWWVIKDNNYLKTNNYDGLLSYSPKGGEDEVVFVYKPFKTIIDRYVLLLRGGYEN